MSWWKDCNLELPRESGFYRTRIYYKNEYCRDTLTLKAVIMYYDSADKSFRVCDGSAPFRYTDLRRDYAVVKVRAWRYNLITSIINSILNWIKGNGSSPSI